MPDRLATYRRKRDFTLTDEPAGERPARRRRGRLKFMIHKHDATALHYDLRLEMEGALASWAVPKGPSFDPTQRRLAVETEDHPLSYFSYEGVIPEGAYGAGPSLVWDRGTYEAVPPGTEAEQRRAGKLTFVLHGEKLQGRWHLVRTRLAGRKPQWLLFKGKDEHARDDYDVTEARPESVKSGRVIVRGERPTLSPRVARAKPAKRRRSP